MASLSSKTREKACFFRDVSTGLICHVSRWSKISPSLLSGVLGFEGYTSDSHPWLNIKITCGAF